MTQYGDAILLDSRGESRRKDCVILSACHAVQLSHYLRMRPDFLDAYNVHSILAHVIAGKQWSTLPDIIPKLLASADVILCNRFQDAVIEPLNVSHHPGKASRRVFIFPPPNSRMWWPICNVGPQVELLGPAQEGKSRAEVWRSFEDGTFDPCFDKRRTLQTAYSLNRDQDCDIKLSGFVECMYRDCKLWFTENHPTFNTIAWIGSEFLRLLGHRTDSEAQLMAYRPDETGTWNAAPETRYEFEHYGLRYPLRWPNEAGGTAHKGMDYYRHLIWSSDAWPKDAK